MKKILAPAFVLLTLVFCIDFSAHAAQPAAPDKPVTPVPVPKDMLDGTRLVLKTAGCSVDLPGPGWSWMTYENAGRNYLCVNAKTFEMYMVAFSELKSDMTDHHPQSLIASAKKTMEAHAGKLENDKYEFIETPGVKKAAKITFTEVEKTKKAFVCVWLFNTVEHILVKMHCSSTGTSEPEAFKTMIKSLKMLDPK